MSTLNGINVKSISERDITKIKSVFFTIAHKFKVFFNLDYELFKQKKYEGRFFTYNGRNVNCPKKYKYLMENPSEGIVIPLRLTGVPPDQALMYIIVPMTATNAEVVKAAQEAYRLNSIIRVNIIYKGTYMDNAMKNDRITTVGFTLGKDMFTVMASLVAAARGQPSLNEHQKLLKGLSRVFIPRLIDELTRILIVDVLIENGVAITHNQVENRRTSRDQLLDMINANDLSQALVDKIFNPGRRRWSWASRLYSILKNIGNAYYFQAKEAELFTDRFSPQSQTNPFSSFVIEKIIDLVSRVKDKDIVISTRLNYIKKLNDYAKRYAPEFKTYDNVQNKPFWILVKALQRVISDERNKYISLTELAKEVFRHDHAFGFAKEIESITNNLRGSLPKTFPTIQRIIDYCKNKINDYTKRQYMYGLIEAVAYASDMIIITPDNPKNTEVKLLGVIRDTLIDCKVFGDSITATDINNYFGVKLTAFYFGSYDYFLKTYTDNQLIKITEKTRQVLMKINSKSANKLLLELSKYIPSRRATELLRMAPNEIVYNNLLSRISEGDSSTLHDPNWASMKDGILGKQVAIAQSFSRVETDQNGRKITVEYMFDGYTGKIYPVDATYSSGRTIWELHHIDHDKTNNNPYNLIWVVKTKDPATSKSSHQTTLAGAKLRQYIAEMRLIKIALKYGYPPKLWGLEQQLEYIRIQQDQGSQYINP